jgi:large subunit ribosomal protein L25
MRWSAVKDQFGTKPAIIGRDFMVASVAAPTVVEEAPAAAPGPVEATKQKAPAGAAAPAKDAKKKK